MLRPALQSDLFFAPTHIYIEIIHYVNIILQTPHNLLPFGASSDRTWEWKSPDIPSQGFLLTFAGASEIIPFSASSYLCRNFPTGTLELIQFGACLDLLWYFQSLDIPSRIFLLFSPLVGVYSDYLFGDNYIFRRWWFTILLPFWGTTSITK